jgi:O-antigen/teichoic acid export membrane protein
MTIACNCGNCKKQIEVLRIVSNCKTNSGYQAGLLLAEGLAALYQAITLPRRAANRCRAGSGMIQPAIQRIRQLLLPRDPASLDDHARGAERNRRAVLTGSAATLARVVQIGTSLITVPLTLKYLGNERFGLWMTISSVLAMAAFADFGVGNGVLNTVAKAFGKDDMEGVRRAVSSGFFALNSIAAFLLLLFFAIYRFVNWADFFRVVSPQARSEAGPALAVFAMCFALNISMDVVQRVQLGLQQGYRYGLWQLCGNAMGFVGVLGGIWLHVSLPVLVVAIAGAPIFATTLNTIHFFGFVRPDLRPSRDLVSRDVISQITRLGGFFFILQVVVAVSYSADNFIIARMLGAVRVPEYSIPQRMFALITMMSAMLIAPLWPAYGEAISRGDTRWVRRTLSRSLLLVFSSTCLVSGMLLLLSRHLIFWWVGPHINPPTVLLLGLAVWTVIDCCGNAVAMFMNGASIMRFQIVVASLFGIACVSTKFALVHRYGIVAVPWSTIVTYLLFSAFPCGIYVLRFFRRAYPSSPIDGYDTSRPLIAKD